VAKVKFLDLRKQYDGIRDDMDAAIAAVLDGSSFIGGPFVNEFEEEFARFAGARHCIGVANGTDALEIALECLNLPANSDVIVPANSFISTAEAVTRCGHRVVFADCGTDFLLDVSDARRRVTDKTAAIIPVHLYGQMCDMKAVRALADDAGLRIIEDAAQAHGATFDGSPVGALGDYATYSFYPGKNLGAYGDGGAITTDDDELARSARMLANHGRIGKYDHEFEGRNSRLDGLQASILSVKLRHLGDWIDRRQRCAAIYNASLKDVPGVQLPEVNPVCSHVYHLYVVRCDTRDALKEFLVTRGIQTGIHYPQSLPRLAAYSYLDARDSTPRANAFAPLLLSLPIGDHLEDQEVEYVASCVREFF